MTGLGPALVSSVAHPRAPIVQVNGRSTCRIGSVVLQIRNFRLPPLFVGDALAPLDDRADLDVERLAGGEADLRAHRRVADRVLADELRIAAGVALIDADRAGRQRIAEPLSRELEKRSTVLALSGWSLVDSQPLRYS